MWIIIYKGTLKSTPIIVFYCHVIKAKMFKSKHNFTGRNKLNKDFNLPPKYFIILIIIYNHFKTIFKDLFNINQFPVSVYYRLLSQNFPSNSCVNLSESKRLTPALFRMSQRNTRSLEHMLKATVVQRQQM